MAVRVLTVTTRVAAAIDATRPVDVCVVWLLVKQARVDYVRTILWAGTSMYIPYSTYLFDLLANRALPSVEAKEKVS